MVFKQDKNVTLLGNAWHHSVNTRIELIPQKENFQMILAKSPMYPMTMVEYCIDAKGLI